MKGSWRSPRPGAMARSSATTPALCSRTCTITARSTLSWMSIGCIRIAGAALTGYRLLQEAERNLKARGVKKVFSGTKLHLDMGRLFDRLGWRRNGAPLHQIPGGLIEWLQQLGPGLPSHRLQPA